MSQKNKEYSSETSFDLAIKNVAELGDTDIFPFPVENVVFKDKKEEIKQELKDLDKDIDKYLGTYPQSNIFSLAPSGYSGFRLATQMDPIWNVYLLSLIIKLGKKIEDKRISTKEETIFSYRFNPDKENGTIFDKKIGWKNFRDKSIEYANNYSHVLVCDIADFYLRIGHHPLENALEEIDDGKETCRKIMKILGQYRDRRSFGLPIGGPAARLMAECVLNVTDTIFRAGDLTFCRFADDYHFFANSEDEAYRILVFISEKLYMNEGLSLNKSKTRIMTSGEFLSSVKMLGDHENNPERGSLLSLTLKFDPYSSNAEEEYEELKKMVGKHDILGFLSSELDKVRVHSPTLKQLLRAIRFLNAGGKKDAALTLSGNIKTLAPLFGLLTITLINIKGELDDKTWGKIVEEYVDLFRKDSFVIKIDLNVAFAIRLFALCNDKDTEIILSRLYNESGSPLIKREVLYAFTKRVNRALIADKRNIFAYMSPWERRAFIIATACMGEEGDKWRSSNKKIFTPFEKILIKWTLERPGSIASGGLSL